MVGDRSISEVLQAIVADVQGIMRSEVRLAKTELREEAVKTKTSAIWLGAGTAASLFATLFLLLAVMLAIATALPAWASALIVGAALAVVAAAALAGGMRRFRTIHPAPPHTVETVKENIEWVKQKSK